jgi:hypothetical protein
VSLQNKAAAIATTFVVDGQTRDNLVLTGNQSSVQSALGKLI